MSAVGVCLGNTVLTVEFVGGSLGEAVETHVLPFLPIGANTDMIGFSCRREQ
jgi:hypothetical protein